MCLGEGTYHPASLLSYQHQWSHLHGLLDNNLQGEVHIRKAASNMEKCSKSIVFSCPKTWNNHSSCFLHQSFPISLFFLNEISSPGPPLDQVHVISQSCLQSSLKKTFFWKFETKSNTHQTNIPSKFLSTTSRVHQRSLKAFLISSNHGTLDVKVEITMTAFGGTPWKRAALG